jgi:hypothetical protein
MSSRLRVLASLLLVPLAVCAAPSRQTLNLDGMWDVEESVESAQQPAAFAHRAPVPGLTHSAVPAFADVDRFDSREAIATRVMLEELPESALVSSAGISHQSRNFFWYRTHFSAPLRRELATLTVNKAQFGSEVFVNGKSVGTHIGCSTSASYDITREVRWAARNELLIRIGAHPGVLPAGNPCGIDFEKLYWTPGIYDSVSVRFTDATTIDAAQIAPQLEPRGIRVQTTLRNAGSKSKHMPLHYTVSSPDGRFELAETTDSLALAAGETKVVTRTIALPGARLWTPEEPQLYLLKSSVSGDEVVTRFGLREFRFDTVTRRAYLNGKPYFLRGSNITLHRFFEDPESGTLPWDEAWVRKLLGENARRMHWNAMRFSIGPVPQKWLDIADEEGLLVQYEFPIWLASPRRLPPTIPVKKFDAGQLIAEFSQWMRDAWNHPSVVIWDASNETELPMLGQTVIPAVRGLDLSRRPWENGYNPPAGADDPVEDHVYEFIYNTRPGEAPAFDMTDLEQQGPSRKLSLTPPSAHAMILNEYGWLWLNRDGSPSRLTQEVYPKLPYPHESAQQRLETQAYLLAGLTEYWRAFRQYAGVMHFAYLTGSFPDAFTSDNFKDVRTLEFQPYFLQYVGEAFKPLGVYIHFWRRELPVSSDQEFQIMVIDDGAGGEGTLSVRVENAAGQPAATTTVSYAVPASGQQTYYVRVKMPDTPGAYRLEAIATPSDKSRESTTSRRWLSLVPRP